MDRLIDDGSLDKVFHKESNQRKTTDKRSTDNRTIDYSTVVKGNTVVNSISEQIEVHQNRHQALGQKKLADKERNHKQLRNLEIDGHLHGWIMEGLVDQAYMAWVARCCHTLGLETVNRLAINARNGKYPQRLFSSLLKGSMNLKAKQDYYDITTINPDSATAIGE